MDYTCACLFCAIFGVLRFTFLKHQGRNKIGQHFANNIFDSDFTEVCLIDYNSCDKPLSEPMMTHFSHTIMHLLASMWNFVHFLMYCHMASCVCVNIMSGNGLLMVSTKPLPETMMFHLQLDPRNKLQ